MELSEQFKSNEYLCWVKAGLTLKNLKAGLCPFIESIANSKHAKLLEGAKICSECTIEKLKAKSRPQGKRTRPKSQNDCESRDGDRDE